MTIHGSEVMQIPFSLLPFFLSFFFFFFFFFFQGTPPASTIAAWQNIDSRFSDELPLEGQVLKQHRIGGDMCKW